MSQATLIDRDDIPDITPGQAVLLPFVETDKPRELVPFPFQAEMLSALYRHIRANERTILMVAPTGSGKTLLSALVMLDATLKAKKPIRCVFLVDLNCLINQTIEEFERLGLQCAVLQGSKSKSKRAIKQLAKASVIVASVQTLTARMKRGATLKDLLGRVGLVFEDEAHNTSQSRVALALREEYAAGTVIVGLTATPWLPGSKRWLGQKYNAKVLAPPMSELIRLGRVVPCQPFSVNGVLDVQSLDVDAKTGDFSDFQMGNMIGKKTSLDRIVSEWIRLGEGRSTIAYCPKIESAKLLAEAFQAAGISAEWQCGSTPMGWIGKVDHEENKHTRAAQHYRLEQGITKVVCSVGTQTKGFNAPSLGCVMMVRATNVASLFFQCIGRGSRTCDSAVWAHNPYGGKWGKKENYLLLDFGDNLNRFAPLSPNTLGECPERDYDISEPRQYSPPEQDHKYCPVCDEGRSKPLRLFVKLCPDCDYEFGAKDEDQQELDLDFELKEWFDERSAYQASFVRSKRRACYNQNTSPDLATEEFRKRFGFVAPSSWYLNAIANDRILRRPVTDDDIAQFISYLLEHQPSNKHGDLWYKHHFFLEMGEVWDSKRWKKRKVKSKMTLETGWWTVLGLPKQCTIADLKRVYKQLCRECHPDVAGVEGEEKMKEVNNAYDAGKRYLSGF